VKVLIVGAGKVGRALHGALRARGEDATLVHARRVEGRLGFGVDLLVLAAADPFLAKVARDIVERLEDAPRAKRPGAAVHCAGGLGVEPLEAFRSVDIPAGQMHPLLSFAGPAPHSSRGGPGAPPLDFTGATMRVEGDPKAVEAARRVAVLLGMTPRRFEALPPPAYHAAAALVANGAVGLVSAASATLASHGVPPGVSADMLSKLLASVAENIARVGLPEALTGPVRRGDAPTIERHLTYLGEHADLYRAVVAAQLGMARELTQRTGGPSEPALERILQLVSAPPKKDPRPRRTR
jgi:predicted short-subunit dehydrogenase-like oxidoreductase (DUF2520 family)